MADTIQDEDQDQKYNPGAQHAQERFAAGGPDDPLEKAFNDNSQDPSLGALEDQHAAKMRDSKDFVNNYEKPSPAKKHTGKQAVKLALRKFGPAGGVGVVGIVITAILGSIGPASLLVNLKENFVENFDQQAVSAEVRSRKLLVRRLSGDVTTNSCRYINVVCRRYIKPSPRLLKRLGEVNIKAIDKNGKIIAKQRLLAGIRPAEWEFPDGKRVPPKGFATALNEDAAARSAFRRAYNPRWANWVDDVAVKFFSSMGLSKAVPDKLSDADTPEKRQSLVDDLGKGDASTNRQTLEVDINEKTDRFAKSSSKKLAKSPDSVLLSAQVACLGAQVPSIASSVVRAYRMRQIFRVGLMFLTVADSIKAGEATAEQVSYAGSLLTKVVREKSAMDGAMLYGIMGDKSAVTSSKSVGRFIPGSGLGTLDKLSGFSKNTAVKKVCNVTSSQDAQVALSALKVAKLSNPAGWISLVADLALLGADKLGLLEPLIDKAISVGMGVVDELINWDEVLKALVGDETENIQGEELGDVTVVAGATMMGSIANKGGNAALTPEQATAYHRDIVTPTRLAWAEEDRLTHSPFDASNPNTFLGSITTQLLPYYADFATISGSLNAFASLSLGSIKTALQPMTRAAQDNNWGLCTADYSIASSNAAAGPLCDVQFGIPQQYIDLDPVEIVENLYNSNQIDTDGEIIRDSDLENWDLSCTNGDPVLLDACIIDNKEKASFSLYLIDKRMMDSMDNDIDETTGGALTESDTSSTAWPIDKKFFDANPSDFLDSHVMFSGTFTSPYQKGAAVDISGQLGTPIYSMYDGVVTRTNLCGAGDGMIIKSQVQGGTLLAAYGHGIKPRFSVGDPVKAGQQILDEGAAGCKVFGAHLHLDMTYNGEHICPQDVFKGLSENTALDYSSLPGKMRAGCGIP